MNSEERLRTAAERLDHVRTQCGEALEALGKEKITVLEGSLKEFVELFSMIKNVDFTDSVGLEELEKFHIDEKTNIEIDEISGVVSTMAKGALAGVTGGALTAFGAYGAAGTFASASTGTAISTLHGAAATNATMAFFGGGPVAGSGLGVAGGMAVLGGLVAGPALLVMGLITGAKAGKNLENALANSAEVDVACEQLEIANYQCVAIRRRTNMFYNLLARLDSLLLPLVFDMKEVMKYEGYDYTEYTIESKKIIAQAASVAVTVKRVIDTPILSEDGKLIEESETVYNEINKTIE